MSCGPQIRRPSVAGVFYPADAEELRGVVARMLAQVTPRGASPKALIVPHAGYVFSGPVAATAYAELVPLRETITRVVLLGPTHHVHFRGLAATSADAYATPLGNIPLDRAAIESALRLDCVQTLDAAHLREHSLEVQLPFLQVVLDRFELVPLVVGQAEAADTAAVLEHLWGGPETLIVISSDLSHYHDAVTAQRLDAETCRAIEARRADVLTGERACGCRGINGLLTVARRRNLSVTTVDLRNSGDTAGGRDRVVGYGAWLIGAASGETTLSEADRQMLLRLAREAIERGVEGEAPLPLLEDCPPALRPHRATFVTLHKQGELRGCCGSLQAFEPLAWNVIRSARAAAFGDRRFPPVAPEETPELELHISILGEPRPIAFVSEADLVAALRPGVDGVILSERDLRRQGVFLPAVWEQLPEPRQFVRRLKQKAGLDADYWSPWMTAQRFEVESVA